MTINIKLLTFEDITDEGYPLIVMFSHKGKPKQRQIGFSHERHFNKDEQIILKNHPDYDILAPIIADIKVKAKRIKLLRIDDVQKAHHEMFKKDFSGTQFLSFIDKLIDDMKMIVRALEKKKLVKESNKIKGNIRVYENVKSQFEFFASDLTFEELDFVTLERFKNYQLGIGNSKATINLYLRTLRAIYNKGLLIYKLPDEKPFKGVFSGLKTRSHQTKKKSLDKNGILLMESLNLTEAKQRSRDLWLLQFYFGGCDLIDIYYLYKKQIRRGRVVFERGKTNTGLQINLKIHPKAQAILNRYKSDDEWQFPWKKENDSYVTFRRNYQKDLMLIQKLNYIEVLPDGGNLGIKVARHTFANMAKLLNIEPDVVRELMGHERDEVDNFYKDKYPEEVRDNALFEIISSFECLK